MTQGITPCAQGTSLSQRAYHVVINTKQQHTTRGIVFMVLSMAAFAIADTFIKISATVMSSAHTALLLISGSFVVFVLLTLVQRQQLLDRAALSQVLLIRYVAEISATLGMVQALRLVPLSTVGAILQATPLVVAMGAVLLLGERMSWRRWSAISIGFVGVLLIVQPSTQSFDANVLWAILAMLGLSARDLTTRVTPVNMASSSLAAYTMAAAIPFSLVWVMLTESTVLPAAVDWWLVVGMISFGTAGYLMIITSIRIAPVSLVSPYRYSRLLFLLLLGVIIFDERPDILMLIGSFIIIAAGLYTMWRERQHTEIETD